MRTQQERLWRSFVRPREVIEDAATGDEIEARDALTRFCLGTVELRD